MNTQRERPIRATVKRIVSQDPANESYAVAYPTRDYGELTTSDSVTFRLDGKNFQRGQVVELHSVSLFERGWRALAAQPVVPKG